jgi:hypothetical protein
MSDRRKTKSEEANLESAHFAVVRRGGATDEDHRPTVGPRIAQTGQRVYHARTRHGQAHSGTSRHVARSARCSSQDITPMRSRPESPLPVLHVLHHITFFEAHVAAVWHEHRRVIWRILFCHKGCCGWEGTGIAGGLLVAEGPKVNALSLCHHGDVGHRPPNNTELWYSKKMRSAVERTSRASDSQGTHHIGDLECLQRARDHC